ncbi:MAG TPA: hypothetical protein P5556_06290 [Candidatus Gastranaerophilales bacterium]|nr:hypothetical protein [Candidatus Gastranaerophilales bacterium]
MVKFVCVKCWKTHYYLDINWYEFWEMVLLLCGVFPGIIFRLWYMRNPKRLFHKIPLCPGCKSGMIPINHPDLQFFQKISKPPLHQVATDIRQN